MLLKNFLEEHTRDALLDYARSMELKKCSRLRKAALIEKILHDFCTEEILKSRLVCLTEEEMNLFRKACKCPQDISIHEVTASIHLGLYWLGNFEVFTDRFTVFEEVAEAFSRFDNEAFKTEQRKKGWMVTCVRFFVNYYGIAPIEILYQLYQLKVKDSIDEMIDMLWEMPVDIIESCFFPLDGLDLQDWSEEHSIYSPRGLFIHIPLLENEGFSSLLHEQGDKAFYIPSARQLDEFCCNGYEESSPAYRKLKNFFIREMNMTYEQAIAWCLQTWTDSWEGDPPTTVIDTMNELNIGLNSEKQTLQLLNLLMNAHNNTRMKKNRGHSPIELTGEKLSKGMPTIVPGSSHAAEILKEAAPFLREMGMSVDLEGNTDTIPTTIYPGGLNENVVKMEKKVYPNDPCPCGSRKKYKKCCGRR